MLFVLFQTSIIFFLTSTCLSKKLLWRDTKFLFSFGDSYSTNGFNISAGVLSPIAPGLTSSNGQNWIEFLGGTYNVTNTQVFDLASAGATIDSAIVPPKKDTSIPLVVQVEQFRQFLSQKPEGVNWNSNNSLFALWIGLNDIDFSLTWTNVSFPRLYSELLDRLDSQLEDLHDMGARSFMILTVPPTERAPFILQQGPQMVTKVKPLIADFNQQLVDKVKGFQLEHSDVDTFTIFDSQPIFNTLLDNAQTFGFINSTGFCEAYVNGTPDLTTQIDPCAPVSNYFWLNDLHPLFTIHDILAHAVSSMLDSLQ